MTFMLLHHLAPATAQPSAQTVWTSLEVTKLIVSGLTPLVVVGLGFWINRRLKDFEHLQWASQKVVEKRIEVYEEVVPLLNDLLCYFTFLGCWKELTPPDVVGIKRKLDRTMHVNAPLFPPTIMDAYQEFIALCYQTYSGWGKDALLRTPFQHRMEAAGDEWDESWSEYYSDPLKHSEPDKIKAAYHTVVERMASELGIGLQRPHVPAGRVPANIK